jgi:Divergent InlB B-repeat domain
MGRRSAGGLLMLMLALTVTVGQAGGRALAAPTRLVVEVIGAGEVTGTGIDCGGGHTTCYATYSDTGKLALTETPATGWTFDSWQGCADPCSITLDGTDHRIQADFKTAGTVPTRTLAVSCSSAGGCTSGTSPVAASLTTSLSGANNDLVYTARTAGTGGNSISVQYLDPGVTASLSVSVAGTAITVTLGRAGGSITSTAADVRTALAADSGANALVSVGNVPGNDGTGAMTPMPSTFLSGGQAASAAGGDVTDSASPPGVNVDCGSSGASRCTWEVLDQSTLTVVQTPVDGYFFNSWGGDCASGGSGKSCTVQMTSDRNVSATFSSSTATAQLTVAVAGSGSVAGGGISCSGGSTCTANEPTGSSVTLTATPSPGYTLTGWSGDCSGTQSTCTVQMSNARSVTATFALTHQLSVTVAGKGNVTGGTGAGVINCGNGSTQCSAPEPADQSITLTATPAAGSTFVGWNGASCTGVVTTCTIVMNADKAVTAGFSSAGATTLTVAVSGNGTVGGGGINCTAGGGACSANETPNATVTLTATPGAGATFTGWGGACSGVATTCSVSMTSAKTVTAAFSAPAPGTVLLSVSVSGNGTVSGAGVDCGRVCTANESPGASVTLVAKPSKGARFIGWSGACSGTRTTCSVAMTSAKSVTATFSGSAVLGAASATLTLKVVGKGSVTAPAGRCASAGATSTCTQRYPRGTRVTLRAAAAKGAVFRGWRGACSGTKRTCAFTLRSGRSATATFAKGR